MSYDVSVSTRWAPQFQTRSGARIRGADCHTIGQHKSPPNGSDVAAEAPDLPTDIPQIGEAS